MIGWMGDCVGHYLCRLRYKISLSTVLRISCGDWGMCGLARSVDSTDHYLRLSTALIERGACRLYCVLHKERMNPMVM